VGKQHEARLTIKEQEPEPLPPEVRVQQMLEHENKLLRDRVRSLEGAVRTAGRILLPYTADRKR
jgi:hypothetical protein